MIHMAGSSDNIF